MPPNPTNREGELQRRIAELELRLAAAEEKLHAAEERHRLLTETMDEGFVVHQAVCDERGEPQDYRFLEVNPAFERLVGLKREDILGRTRGELLPDENPKWLRLYAEVATIRRSVRFEKRSVMGDRDFEGTLFSPAPGQFAGVFTDATARKQADTELHQLRANLETRVKERTAELELAIAALRRRRRRRRKKSARAKG